MARRRSEQQPLSFDKSDPWNKEPVRDAIRQKLTEDAKNDPNLASRLDDYVNRLTGIGDWMQDKTLGGSRFGLPFAVNYLSAVEIEDRWRGSDLGARIVETRAHEMVREGWDLQVQPTDEDTDDKGDGFGEEPGQDAPPMPGALPPPRMPLEKIDDTGAKIAEEIEGKLEELEAAQALLQALQYETAFGGGAILVGADDGMGDITKPLDETKIKSVDWLNVFQGGRDGEIVAWSYYRDPAQPNYGLPEVYMVRNIGVPLNQIAVPYKTQIAPGQKMIAPVFWVHESRLIVFPGTSVSRRARVQMRGWGDSIFTRVDNVLQQYSQAWSGIANLLTDFKQDVLLVDGLQEKLPGDKIAKGQPLLKRARAIQETRSIARMLVIDKRSEEFKREVASVAGLSDVLQQFAMRLAGAADMPVDLLFSTMSGNALSKGDSTVRFFYDRIASEQRRKLVPRLKKLIRLLFLASDGTTSGVEPSRWSVKMNSLYQLSETEEATRRFSIAQADALYIDKQVLQPEEVAASRFGGSEYSEETTIDFEGRAVMQKQEEKDRQAKLKAMSAAAKQPPAPDKAKKDPIEPSSVE